MIQLASIYERDNKWYFHPSSRTLTGLWILTPPVLELGADDTRERKGHAVIEVLAASVHGIPTPTDGNKVADPLLSASGSKSWSEFMKKAKGVTVERENELRVIPHRKTDNRGSEQAIRGEAIFLADDASAEAIGAAIEEALSRFKNLGNESSSHRQGDASK